jgi:glycerol-3-phosphate acyltransferase PlsY
MRSPMTRPSRHNTKTLSGGFKWRMGFAVAVFLILIFTHRGNIARLFRGEEKQLDIRGMFRRRP